MFINLFRGGKLGQYFTAPLSEVINDITWAKGYVGFVCKVGKVYSEAGVELAPEDKINLNTRVVLEPTRRLELKRGACDIVPTTVLLSFGTPVYQWRLTGDVGENVVRITLRVSKPVKVEDLLGQPLATLFVIDA